MLSGFYPYHVYLSLNNRTTIENMERNSRLLGNFIPRKAEGMLAAGTLDLRDAGLPERPKRTGGGMAIRHDGGPPSLTTAAAAEQNGRHGHSDVAMGLAAEPSSRSNPSLNLFLPDDGRAYPMNASSGYDTGHQQHASSSTSASASLSHQLRLHHRQGRPGVDPGLSRLEIRQLEKKAGKINIYDLGTSSANFREAMGGGWREWQSWVPLGGSRGDGYAFPVNKRKYLKLMRLNEKLRGGARCGV